MQVTLVLKLDRMTRDGARIIRDDVTFVISVNPHPTFTRRGDSLAWTPKISFEDSVNGAVITCPHFDGHFVVRSFL